MKKAIKNIIRIVLLLITIICVCLTSFAQSSHKNLPIQPKGTCIHCNIPIPSITCLKNQIYSYTYPCNRSPSCSIDVYISRSAEICSNCKRYNAYYGFHECVDIHSHCSKGYNVICPVGYMPPSNTNETPQHNHAPL